MDYQNLPPTADSLVAILRKLRAPDGCPWDRAQTQETLSRCMTEECAEYLEALDHHDVPAMCDELGDLLMNVIFQAVVAEEKGEFTLADVLDNLNKKLVRRHAHIFGSEHAENPEQVLAIWEKIKAKEKDHQDRKSLMDGVPAELSALSRAEKLQKRAAKVGFDWSEAGQIVQKIEEETAEFKQAFDSGDDDHADEELGDLLFAIANLTRFRKRRTAEELLRAANDKFSRRFRYIEEKLAERNIPIETAGLDVMEDLWQEAKAALRQQNR